MTEIMIEKLKSLKDKNGNVYIKEGWLDNIDNEIFNKQDENNLSINECIEKCTSPTGEEKIEAIFRAFSLFPSNETQVLILGQDPYPDPNKAQGLAFSCKKGRAASLTKIFKAIDEYKGNGTHKYNYDLTNWAIENKVCLLNAALTFEKSSLYKNNKKKDLTKEQQKKLEKDQQAKQKEHVKAWSDFVVKIMEKLIKENKNLVVFLWGDKAKQLFEKCTGYKTITHIFPTSHPRKRLKHGEIDKFSEETPEHFRACDEFLGKKIWKNFPENNQ